MKVELGSVLAIYDLGMGATWKTAWGECIYRSVRYVDSLMQ